MPRLLFDLAPSAFVTLEAPPPRWSMPLQWATSCALGAATTVVLIAPALAAIVYVVDTTGL